MKNSKKVYVYLATICMSAGFILFIPMLLGDSAQSFVLAAITDVCFLLIIGFIFSDFKVVIYSAITDVIVLVLFLFLLYTDLPESIVYVLLITTTAVGFALLVTGAFFFILNLCYSNKHKKIIPFNATYPLSPKSINEGHLKEIGTEYFNELKASSKKHYLIAGVVGVGCFLLGIVVLTAMYITNLVGFIYFILGVIFALVFVCMGARIKKHYTENTIEQLGQEKLNNYFEQQKTSFNRAIDIPYYSECDDLKSINFTPTVYARGGTFSAIEAADALIDEANGKFAVCTTYGDTTLYPANVFEMSKVLVVSLENKGETIYVTQNQDGAARAMLGYMVAGSLGAMVGASTATTKTVAKKLDDLSVVITYNDLGRAYLTFKFGKDRVGAEKLYQIFTVVCKRNEAKS